MNKEDYNKFYIQGSDHYLIPKDVFDELFEEMESWKEDTQKYKEIIDKATDKCNKTLDYINNTLLKNNVKVELTELLEIKGGLDIILESLVEDQLKRWNK